MKPKFVTSDKLARIDGVVHGFFGREGGVSSGLFESLNCSPFSGDDAADIETNRRRVVDAMGGRILFTNRQVHGREARLVGAEDDPRALVEADGLVTSSRGVCLGALGADCAPVVFADARAGVVGVAHAGWQGALKGVTDSVVEQMENLGATPGDIAAAIGPAIQATSYEVGEKFRDDFCALSPLPAEDFFLRHGVAQTIHFDLSGYISLRLKNAGIPVFDQLKNDTYGDDLGYFSYRRSCHRGEQVYGRQIGVICLS